MPHKKLHVYVNAIDSVFRYRTGALSYKSLTVIINMYTYVFTYWWLSFYAVACIMHVAEPEGLTPLQAHSLSLITDRRSTTRLYRLPNALGILLPFITRLFWTPYVIRLRNLYLCMNIYLSHHSGLNASDTRESFIITTFFIVSTILWFYRFWLLMEINSQKIRLFCFQIGNSQEVNYNKILVTFIILLRRHTRRKINKLMFLANYIIL